MKRLSSITAVLFLISGLFLPTVSAEAGGNANSSSGATVSRPSKGTWSGNSYIVGFCEDESLLSVQIGKGIASQMGTSDWFAIVCTDPVTGTGAGTAVITVANGDAIYLSVSSQVEGWGGLEGTWSQTAIGQGGTGRFAESGGTTTSSGTWVLTSDTSLSWVGTHEGEITY